MKKLLALLLALMMLFSVATVFAGCEDSGKKKSSSSKKDDDDDDEDEDEDKDDEDKDDEDKDDDKDDENKDNGKVTEPQNNQSGSDEPGVQDATKPQQEETDGISGTSWSYEMDYAQVLNQVYSASFGESFVAPSGSLTAEVTMNFKKNGDFVLEMALDEAKSQKYLNNLVDALVDATYAMYAEQGMDADTVDSYYESQAGMTLSEAMSAQLSFESLSQSLNQNKTGVYEVNVAEGRIYVADDEDELHDDDVTFYVYSLSGNKLTISDIFNGEEYATESEEMASNPMMQMPWVMTKK